MDNPNVTPTGPTALSDASDRELEDAADAITGGDSATGRWALDTKRALASVNAAARTALAEARRLHDDDEMNPQGKARRLSELPGRLRAETSFALEAAEMNLDIIEGSHLAAILKHDGRNDHNLIAELNNYVAGMNPQNAVAGLVALAGDVRYSTFLSGPFGKSLAARFGFKPEVLQKTALQALAVNGTPDQVRRAAALAAIPAARRALTLARAGRDHVATETQRAPAPKPSAALM